MRKEITELTDQETEDAFNSVDNLFRDPINDAIKLKLFNLIDNALYIGSIKHPDSIYFFFTHKKVEFIYHHKTKNLTIAFNGNMIYDEIDETGGYLCSKARERIYKLASTWGDKTSVADFLKL